MQVQPSLAIPLSLNLLYLNWVIRIVKFTFFDHNIAKHGNFFFHTQQQNDFFCNVIFLILR